MEQMVALAASVSLHDGTVSLQPLARSGEICRSRPPDSNARAVLYRDTDSALGLRKIWRAHTRRAVDAHALQRPAAVAARTRSIATRRTSPVRAQSACSYLACPRPVPGKLLPNRFSLPFSHSLNFSPGARHQRIAACHCSTLLLPCNEESSTDSATIFSVKFYHDRKFRVK